LEVKPELKEALEESIAKAERLDAPTLTAYYQFLDEMVTMIPTERNLLPKCLEFYYLGGVYIHSYLSAHLMTMN